MPARTQAIGAEGLSEATISPAPRTKAAADPLVPTCWSSPARAVPIWVATAPPTSPMPIRSIPIRRISRLTGTNVYGRYRLSLGLDSINGQRSTHHARRAGGRPEGARRAHRQPPAVDRRQDQGGPGARRPIRKLRVPRRQERAGNDGGADQRDRKSTRLNSSHSSISYA